MSSSLSKSQTQWILLGASRGLGAATCQRLKSNNDNHVLVFSRKLTGWDFSISSDWSKHGQTLVEYILAHDGPSRILYFAGGGPYGRFEQKQWQDHQWAWKVSFEAPAFLLHALLTSAQDTQKLVQFTVVGSAVAESKADASASSYAAAKHALKGLITSIQAEGAKKFDVRLFSPGYMDTAMLPQNAWPRQSENLVTTPEAVAEVLVDWLENSTYANGYKVFE